jgi:hypothetical protein
MGCPASSTTQMFSGAVPEYDVVVLLPRLVLVPLLNGGFSPMKSFTVAWHELWSDRE